MSNLLTIDETVVPTDLIHYDRMRAATITAGVADGYALGEVLSHLEGIADQVLPPSVRVSYSGESKEFKQASGALLTTFLLAFLVIYLVLAAQFESFLHPFTILLSVPPAVTGALATLWLVGGTLNVYSEIGLIMLLGLITKNAILIVDFANQLRAKGLDLRPAIIDAAVMRMRPILMTTLATILGAVPLAVATGPGSAGRQQIGYVVVGGMLVSTLLTLFIVPAVHLLIACRWSGVSAGRRDDIADEVEALADPSPTPAYAGKPL